MAAQEEKEEVSAGLGNALGGLGNMLGGAIGGCDMQNPKPPYPPWMQQQFPLPPGQGHLPFQHQPQLSPFPQQTPFPLPLFRQRQQTQTAATSPEEGLCRKSFNELLLVLLACTYAIMGITIQQLYIAGSEGTAPAAIFGAVAAIAAPAFIFMECWKK